MAVELNKNELKDLLLDSYELIYKIPPPKPPKYEVQSRSKLKNLPEALRESSDPEAAVMHFVKSASYFLPRSDSNLRDYLDLLLKKVQKIQKSDSDPEKVREKIKYLIGYSNWGMDAVCNIFKDGSSDKEVRARLQNMVGAELKILESTEERDKIVNDLMEWKASAESRRY
ncbi:hypothetical protein [Methanomethylovorans sp.]|uniref:hypothetical protein n=1 Tax=Methanomethylovorans sp. TaxID=2758717 RepID=UPI00345EE8FA